MEVYKPVRKKERTQLKKFFLRYVVILACFWGISLFLGRVVIETQEHNPLLFEHSLSSSDISEKRHRFFMFTGLLKNRISSQEISFSSQIPPRGAVVLVHNRYVGISENEWYVSLLRFIRKGAHVMTFGIISLESNDLLLKVVAIPGDEIVYSSKQVFSVNGVSLETSSQERRSGNDVPFFDTPNTLRLKENEVFLSNGKEYGVDDRLLGPTPISLIKGKSVFLLGPRWGLIESF